MTGINQMFDLDVTGKVTISALGLLIPVFGRIYDEYKDKDLAFKYIRYIILKHYWRSPYHVYGDALSREYKVKESLFGDKDYVIPLDVLESEREYADELQSSEIIQLMDSLRIGINYMNKRFRNIDSELPNPNDVVKWTEKLGLMLISLDQLERKVKDEELLSGKIKGDRKLKASEVPIRN